jgi:hypothetical protein
VGQSELVFIGTVTRVDVPPKGFKTAKMHIDRVFKGRLGEVEELFDDGWCNGPNLQVGHQYLMYTRRSPYGAIAARGCTRSRAIEDADEDLKFLEQYALGKVKTQVSGTVRFRPERAEDTEAARTPIRGVHIDLKGKEKQFEALTDAAGHYAFPDLPADEYRIGAQLDGYSVNWIIEKISLQSKACVVSDVLMKVDRRIQGVVRDERGAAVSGAAVELIPTQVEPDSKYLFTLDSVSDDDGRYRIDGIPPGEYYLGTSIESMPTKEYPFPRVYFPGVKNRNEAVIISIGENPVVHEYDLHIPGKLPLVEIHGRIVNADGNPPTPGDHVRIRFTEPGSLDEIGNQEIEVDAEGRFRLALCEGVIYGAYAFGGPAGKSKYSARIEFVASKDNPGLEFVLTKSYDEFFKRPQK